MLFVSLGVRKAVPEGEPELSRGIYVYGDRRVNERGMGPSAGRREVSATARGMERERERAGEKVGGGDGRMRLQGREHMCCWVSMCTHMCSIHRWHRHMLHL